MLLMIKYLIIFFLPLSSYAGEYSNRVSRVASDYEENLTKTKLYGEVFRSEITKDGRLGCARVVQILLKEAEVPGFDRTLYAVRNIQKLTKDWRTVAYDDIAPGDIIFWKKRFSDNICSGGGDCHVGIAIGNDRTINNNGLWKHPINSRIKGRLMWEFMYAKRMK